MSEAGSNTAAWATRSTASRYCPRGPASNAYQPQLVATVESSASA